EFDLATMKQLRHWLYGKILWEWQRQKIAPRFERNDIRFISIGRKHRAHQLAYGIFTGQIKPKEDIRVKRRVMLSLLK
ncbi:MAG: hypothetical protein ACE5JP_09420, partial [Candidatus Bipolaricaulia bacterium]